MRNFKLLIVIFLSTFIFSDLAAQSAAEGETLFNSRQYAKAKTVYGALLKRNPKDALNNYRYARCYSGFHSQRCVFYDNCFVGL